MDWDQLDAAIAQFGGGAHGTLAAAATETPTEAEPATAAAGAPPARLVDFKVVSALREVTGAQELSNLMSVGMNAYGDYCNAMLDPANGPKEIRAEAHKLKGSAGTMGLRAISAVAARIELAVDEGLNAYHLVRELMQTISDTRGELAEMGLLADPGTPAVEAGARASDS